jgi:hypothetical protein
MCTLVEHKIVHLDKLIGSRTKSHIPYAVYKTDLSVKNQLLKLYDPGKTIINDQSIIFLGSKSVLMILFNWSGLHELVDFIEKNLLKINNERKVRLIKYDIDRCLTNLSKNFKDIIKSFPDMIIKNDCLELVNPLIPDKILSQNKLNDIPIEKQIKIVKLSIYTDHNGFITSVRLKGKHPNANPEGWYCLGTLKLMPLTHETINLLLSQIKVYKLDDCYWKPEWV